MPITPSSNDLCWQNADPFTKQQDAKYRSLFESIDDGVAIIEVFPDQQVRIIE